MQSSFGYGFRKVQGAEVPSNCPATVRCGKNACRDYIPLSGALALKKHFHGSRLISRSSQGRPRHSRSIPQGCLYTPEVRTQSRKERLSQISWDLAGTITVKP
jgi:hypothetical protein